MDLPDGEILDKTMADQVRLHHIIFLEKFILTAIARTNGALMTETHTMLFRSGNKFSQTMQKSQIVANPRYLVNPLCHVHN